LKHCLQYRDDPNEINWINEGLYELSSFLCGYGLRSPEKYLKNSHLGLSSWDNDNPLPHYSRVALWTYYLYEKYDLPLISEIAKNVEIGGNGVNSALNILGINKDLSEISRDFFKTLASNDPNISAEFSFTRSMLQYIKALPTDRAINYSFKKDTTLAPLSFRMIEFTNGDSLDIAVGGVSVENLISNKLGFENNLYFNEHFSTIIVDDEFGDTYHTLVLYLINNSFDSRNLSITAGASQKYDINTVTYANEPHTYFITSTGNTNAIQYFAENDTTLLKSVEFYNSGGYGDIKLHLYNSSLSLGSNPSSETIIIKNIVNSGWTRLDVENIQYFRKTNNLIDVGIEYLGNGAMGYKDASGTKHTSRSFLKLAHTNFAELNSFSIDGGNSNLTGAWMIRLELATPYKESSRIRNVNISPNPFAANGSSVVKIEYDGKPTDVIIRIFNSLGQLVYSKNTNAEFITWDGKNNLGSNVASGMYFVSVGSKNKTKYRRFVLLR